MYPSMYHYEQQYHYNTQIVRQSRQLRVGHAHLRGTSLDPSAGFSSSLPQTAHPSTNQHEYFNASRRNVVITPIQSYGGATTSRSSLQRQRRSFEMADGYGPYEQPMHALQTAGTTDFPVYPSTSTAAMPIPPAQPLNVSTTGGYGGSMGPQSGPMLSTPRSTLNYDGYQQQQQQQQQLPQSWQQPQSYQPRESYNMPPQILQREYEILRREYDAATQKLNDTMNSIKTFWSPELKRERAMRKEELTKLSMMNEQLRQTTGDYQQLRHMHEEMALRGETGRGTQERETMRQDRDRFHRELQHSKETVHELELQMDTQRQTLTSRDDSIRKLLDMLQSKGQLPYNMQAQHLELEESRTRVIELDSRCRHAEGSLQQKNSDVRSLQDECLNASDKLRQMQTQIDWLQKMPPASTSSAMSGGGVDGGRVTQLEKQLRYYEEEIGLLREQLATGGPRNFTDKSVTSGEYQDMRLKMEKLEIEVSHKGAELNSSMTRCNAAEEQLKDMKRHFTIIKETNSAKEAQMVLLQSDIEALRTKLETKNDTIEQKTTHITQTQQDLYKLKGSVTDMQEAHKLKDAKLIMHERKVDGLQEVIHEKEQQIEQLRQRLTIAPHVQQQKAMSDAIEESHRDRQRLQRELQEQQSQYEADRRATSNDQRQECHDLRSAVDSLQKDIDDRQVLIESQDAKIGDMNKELSHCKKMSGRLGYPNAFSDDQDETAQLSSELNTARNEVDKLLSMVKSLDRDRDTSETRVKDLQRQLEESRRTDRRSTGGDGSLRLNTTEQDILRVKDQRIEELEEALRESVSITAEREMAIAQQKQVAVQLDNRMHAYKEQLNQLQGQYNNVTTQVSVLDTETHDKDSMIRGMKHERRKHLEEVLQLKHESLVAAISEKDSHIAMLEMQNESADKLQHARRQREKMMHKLKEENERRVRLLNDVKNDMVTDLTAPMSRSLLGSAHDQDDEDGIWA